MIDESLVDLESLLVARELGYSGVALKACKGQSGALLMGAAAQKYGMFLCVQDLTCPGASFLHSASLAARIPGVAAIEGNARQYCPAGNRGWAERFPTMFRVQRRNDRHGRARRARAGILKRHASRRYLWSNQHLGRKKSRKKFSRRRRFLAGEISVGVLRKNSICSPAHPWGRVAP